MILSLLALELLFSQLTPAQLFSADSVNPPVEQALPAESIPRPPGNEKETASPPPIQNGAIRAPGKWSCGEQYWVGPATVEDGHFLGTLGIDCILVSPDGPGIVALDEYFVAKIKKAKQIHGDPVQEQYANLGSVKYDITEEMGNGDEILVVREDVHLGTDLKTHYIYASDSTSTEGTGNAALVRKLDSSLNIFADSQIKGEYTAKMKTTIRVEKPWYAPPGVFEDTVKKTVQQQFQDKVNQVFPELANQI